MADCKNVQSPIAEKTITLFVCQVCSGVEDQGTAMIHTLAISDIVKDMNSAIGTCSTPEEWNSYVQKAIEDPEKRQVAMLVPRSSAWIATVLTSGNFKLCVMNITQPWCHGGNGPWHA